MSFVKNNSGSVLKVREYRQTLKTWILNPVMVALFSHEVMAESSATRFVSASREFVCDGYCMNRRLKVEFSGEKSAYIK